MTLRWVTVCIVAHACWICAGHHAMAGRWAKMLAVGLSTFHCTCHLPHGDITKHNTLCAFPSQPSCEHPPPQPPPSSPKPSLTDRLVWMMSRSSSKKMSPAHTPQMKESAVKFSVGFNLPLHVTCMYLHVNITLMDIVPGSEPAGCSWQLPRG
jgi:hypothetical protein